MESIVLVGVCIIIAIVTGFALYNDSDSVILVVMTIMAVACLIMPLMDYDAQRSKKADIQQCLDKNYSIYIDGRRVKEENIDVFSYKAKIDKKHKKLILSDTNSR